MRIAFFLFLAVLGTFPGLTRAQQVPVLVELYTSQGCSSCPPADKLMERLAARGDVVALSLHVDYWDYIGWRDGFADPAHTARQKAYAKRANRRSIYTPQMIINGTDDVIGARSMELAELIMIHAARPPAVLLRAQRAKGRIAIHAEHAEGRVPGELVVQLFRYTPKRSVKILRGENAGHQMSYVNVVSDMTVVGAWNGRAPLTLDLPLAGDDEAVVVIQDGTSGPVIAVARAK